MIHQVTYMVYVTPHSTHFPPMWLKPNHLHQISFSSHREIYIGSLKLEHRYPLITLACLQSVCGLVCDFFPTNQSFDDGSLSFEHIHFGCWLWELHHIYRINFNVLITFS